MKSLLAKILPASDQRAARQTLWLGAITAVQVLAGIIHVTFAARILGPEGFGILVIVIAAASLVFGIATIPGEEVITTYATRSIARGRPEEAARVLRLAFGAALGMRLLSYGLIAAGTLIAAGLLGLVNSDYVLPMLLYSVTGVLTSVSGESVAVLRLADRLQFGFAVTVASALSGAAVLLWAWSTGGGLPMVIMSSVTRTAVLGTGMALLVVLSASRAGIPGLLRSLSVKVPRDVRRFQIVSFGRSSVEALHVHADALLLAGLTSAAQVGLYRAARYVIDSTKLPVLSLSQALQVEYSRQWFGANGAGVRNMSRRFTAMVVAVAALGYGLLAIFHQPLIRILLGQEFAEASSPLLFMLPGAFVFTSIAALYVMPTATGRATPHLIAMSAAVAAQAVVIVLLAPSHGADGAAWAATIHSLVFAMTIIPFVIHILRQTYKLPPATETRR